MPHCTRKGCGKEFGQDGTDQCTYHPGAPVFHEGLKSWSCCADINKPVLDFDEFMKISGCMQADHHTEEVPKAETSKPSPPAALTLSSSGSEKEVYTYAKNQSIHSPIPAPTPPPPPILEEDDLSVPVNPGTLCRRNGCKTAFTSDDINRRGDGEGAICIYHPAPPIFREGSKGYLCCKRRVLEFDEFLKIPGCKTGRHLFSPHKSTAIEEMTICRIDHYQTVDKVYVSIFAKQVDKERSSIKFNETEVAIDIYLPGQKRFLRVLDLFGPIDPTRSSVQFFGTKVELQLQKRDTRSWTVLERTAQDISNINLTFGVGGRTGTIGAKDFILDETNKARG